MCEELQEKVENAGIKIQEVRITHLAYAPEIASACFRDSRLRQLSTPVRKS